MNSPSLRSPCGRSVTSPRLLCEVILGTISPRLTLVASPDWLTTALVGTPDWLTTACSCIRLSRRLATRVTNCRCGADRAAPWWRHSPSLREMSVMSSCEHMTIQMTVACIQGQCRSVVHSATESPSGQPCH